MTDGRGTSFGRVAALYEQTRPSYPDAAVDHILSLVDNPRTVIDVGCGTGKASRLFTARGLTVIGVEPDPDMAAIARAHASKVHVTRFEDWDGPAQPVDLVVSAQAWHWVDPAVRLPKAVAMLRPGGVLAVMANVPRDGGHDRRDELDPVYERVVGGLVQTTGMLNWDGYFEDLSPSFHLDWDQHLSADEYVELLQTHSDYLVLDPSVLAALVDAVRTAIGVQGVTMRYRTTVAIRYSSVGANP